MAGMNQTQVTELVLLGFSHGRPFLFALSLAIYLAMLLGNSAILSLVPLVPHLHSPMHFFLSQLSCLDLCYSSVTVPKILANALHPQATISYRGCLAQMLFLMWCAGAECALLAVMACDHHAAMCQPLLYTQAMSRSPCVPPAAGCWPWGPRDSAVHTVLAAQLQHIFCYELLLPGAACSTTRPNELALHVSSIFVGLRRRSQQPFLHVVISYLCIPTTLLGMPLATSQCKALSTCSAHLLVVTLYFDRQTQPVGFPRIKH